MTRYGHELRTASLKQGSGELPTPGKDLRVVEPVTVADQGRMAAKANGRKGVILSQTNGAGWHKVQQPPCRTSGSDRGALGNPRPQLVLYQPVDVNKAVNTARSSHKTRVGPCFRFF